MVKSFHPPFKNSDRGRKASDYNRAFRNPVIRIPQSIEDPQVDYDLIADGQMLGVSAITGQAPDLFGVFDDSAAVSSKFTDDTTDAGSAGAGDHTFLPATEEDELDYAIYGQLEPFFGININLGTLGIGGAVAWEYCYAEGADGEGLWAAFPFTFDETAGLTADGQVLFAVPETWRPVALTEVDTVERYYVRSRVTTVYSTNPVGDQMWIYEMGDATLAGAYKAAATGLVESLMAVAVTAGGGNTDTVIQLINHTKQQRGYYSADNSANVVEFAATKSCYVESGDDLTLMVLQEDGTTELQTVDLSLLITI